MIQQHILILSIGPVQSFIAEARRTADLYAGSHILVELARSMVEAINDNEGTLIYPASENLKTADMPNKMVAIVDKPHEIAKTAQRAMLKRWLEFAKSAFEQLKLGVTLHLTDELEIEVSCDDQILQHIDDQILQHIIKRQLNQHPEFYWVAVPLNGHYDEAYKKADRAFGARKQTRNFGQVIEDGFKDSLSGARSALRRDKDKDARAFWEIIQQLPKFRQKLQEKELLDTIGVIKRFGSDEKFPSTSTVATTSYVQNTNLQELQTAIQACNDSLKGHFHAITPSLETGFDQIKEQGKGGCFYKVNKWRDDNFEYDGDLLYLDTYSLQNLASRYNFSEDDYRKVLPNIEQIRELLQNLYKFVGKRPSPYYAIVQMDGDSMGKHVSQCTSKDDHQQISKFLDDFTQSVDGLVKKHHGYRIYAGGDDVLAFFPAECVLSAAQVLAQKYRKLFEGHKTDDREEFPFTASIGIAFAHYLDPLDLVLRTAHDAEKRAKNQYGRDAIAVTILRRSGETLEVGGKWANTVSMVDTLSDLFKTDAISSRFPYNVLREAEVVTNLNQDGRAAMLKLLLNRAINTAEKETIDKDGLLKTWLQWAKAHDKKENGANNNQGYVELARWFVVARWLSVGGQE